MKISHTSKSILAGKARSLKTVRREEWTEGIDEALRSERSIVFSGLTSGRR